MLWPGRRAGARNVAGVRYQLRLTLVILVRAAHGDFPATAVKPEGLEDVDVIPLPGRERRFVQAKEQALEESFLGVGDLADFMAHITPVLRDDPDAVGCLVTNGRFDGGLEVTGWDTSLEPSEEVVDNVARVLEGVQRDEALALLCRVRLVHDDADLAVAVMELADRRGVDPAVAQLALDRCLARVGDAAAEQAQRPATEPVILGLGELDAAVESAVLATTTAAVPAEELRRVVAPLTFELPSTLSPEEFLRGVDVRPEHVAAGLDVVRREELDKITSALAESRLALIVGPSGAGKSALLWRTAAEHSVRMRVWRVHVLLEADADVVVAAIRQQRPTELYPVLVCVDDIGRATRAGWRRAADTLLEMPGVYLVGAAREEDFAPADALRRALIVRPTLTRRTAEQIDQALRDRGVIPAMAAVEAAARAGGLLMEFLHLMVAGRRLSAVLAEQAAGLEEDPGRATELEVARLVTAAHSVGVEVPSDVLQRRAGGPGLAAALSRLDREHLLVESAGGVWTGLHELRSAELRELLHQRPPPHVSDTMVAVVADGDGAAVADKLPAIVAVAGDDAKLAAAVAERVAAEAASGSAWLEGARMADVAQHARACLAVAHTLPLPSTLNIGHWMTMASMSRFAGVDLSIFPAEFHRLAAELPAPDPRLFPAAVASLSEDEWVLRVLALSPVEATRLLEALETEVSWSEAAAGRLTAPLPTGDVRLDARWIASLHRGCGSRAARAALLAGLPSPAERLAALRDEWPLLIEAHLDTASGACVNRFVHPIDGGVSPETQAAELAAIVLDLLPEALVAEVTVTRYDGADLPIHGKRGPHKAIPRENMPSQVVTRWNRAFGDWVERELSSASLTARLREQAAAVSLAVDLVVAMVGRVTAPPSDRRGLHKWDGRRQRLQRDVAALKASPKPEPVVLAPLGSAPRSRGDDAAQALERLATGMQQFADAAADGHSAMYRPRMRLVGSQLRDAAKDYRAAVAAGGPRYEGEPDPLDPVLADVLEDAAAVLIGYADGARLTLPPGQLTMQALHDAAVDVRDSQLAAERELLEQVLAAIPGADAGAAELIGYSESVAMVADPRRWLLPVQVEGHAAVVDTLLQLVRSAEISHPLSFRMIVAPADGGVLFSYTATVIGSRDAFPVIDVDELHALAAEAGIPVRPGKFVSESGACTAALVRASRAAGAAAKMTGTRQEAHLRGQAVDELADADRLLEMIDVLEVAVPLRQVADDVRDELAGKGPGGLALQFDDAHTNGTIGDSIALLETALQGAATS